LRKSLRFSAIVAAEPNRPAMKVPLAWRILTHDKRRTALALTGIFMAILLVFVELGFFYAVPRGGLLLYDNMRFDLLLTSNQYEYQAQPGVFSLSQLEQMRSSPDVAEATPIYFGFAKWKSGEGDLWPDVFIIGFDPASRTFIPDSINRQASVLNQVDTVLVDKSTRPIFGPARHGSGRRDRRSQDDDRRAIYPGNGFHGTRGSPDQHSEFCAPVSAARLGHRQSRRNTAQSGRGPPPRGG
jgi:putative ABC transport system permease protein